MNSHFVKSLLLLLATILAPLYPAAALAESGSNLYGLEDLNPTEKSFCEWPLNIGVCLTARDLAGQATNAAEAIAMQTGWGIHNGGADAFRHCYWSALMTKQMGVATAKGFGDRHEADPTEPYAEKNMDLHNNAMGRSWAFASEGIWTRCAHGVGTGELIRLQQP